MERRLVSGHVELGRWMGGGTRVWQGDGGLGTTYPSCFWLGHGMGRYLPSGRKTMGLCVCRCNLSCVVLGSSSSTSELP